MMILNKKPSGRPSKKPDSTTLTMMYVAKTAKEIANEYGVSESTVRRWVHDYRVAERSK